MLLFGFLLLFLLLELQNRSDIEETFVKYAMLYHHFGIISETTCLRIWLGDHFAGWNHLTGCTDHTLRLLVIVLESWLAFVSHNFVTRALIVLWLLRKQKNQQLLAKNST